MRRLLIAAALASLCSSGTATAQPAFRPGPSGTAVAPGNNPAFSPYLNLLRPGTNPAVNYYGLVKPVVDFGSSINNLQQQVTDIAAPGTGLATGTEQILTTGGNRPRFLSTGNYFQSGVQAGNLSGRGGGGGTSGGSGSVSGASSGFRMSNTSVNSQSMGGYVPQALPQNNR